MRIAAVVLAAGEGRRIGRPKALLDLGGETFLARCVRTLTRPDVSDIYVVLGHDFEMVNALLPPRARAVRNARYRDGMLSSVLAGLDAAAAAGAEAILVHPVDHPAVAPETVDAVAAAIIAGAIIAVPAHAGRRGHPAGFACAAWPALRSAPADQGARAVLATHPDWVTHVAGDRYCSVGVNTTHDWLSLQRALSGADSGPPGQPSRE